MQYSTKEDMFMAALASNARLIHDGVAAYRADSVSRTLLLVHHHCMGDPATAIQPACM